MRAVIVGAVINTLILSVLIWLSYQVGRRDGVAEAQPTAAKIERTCAAWWFGETDANILSARERICRNK